MDKEKDETERFSVHLQKYVPYVEQLIGQLREHQNRQAQLNKLEELLSMITDRRKKIRLFTLKKCQEVILKMLQKANPAAYEKLKRYDAEHGFASSNHVMIKQEIKTEPESYGYQAPINVKQERNVYSTPASPSSPRDQFVSNYQQPVVIPTEKIREKPRVKIEKPDIYSIAAESLINKEKTVSTSSYQPPMEVLRPPLSTKDLEDLNSEDTSNNTTNNDYDYSTLTTDNLMNLREQLKLEIDHSPAKHEDLMESELERRIEAEKASNPPILMKREKPVFKRLADKYNPRPRKPSEVATPKDDLLADIPIQRKPAVFSKTYTPNSAIVLAPMGQEAFMQTSQFVPSPPINFTPKSQVIQQQAFRPDGFSQQARNFNEFGPGKNGPFNRGSQLSPQQQPPLHIQQLQQQQLQQQQLQQQQLQQQQQTQPNRIPSPSKAFHPFDPINPQRININDPRLRPKDERPSSYQSQQQQQQQTQQLSPQQKNSRDPRLDRRNLQNNSPGRSGNFKIPKKTGANRARRRIRSFSDDSDNNETNKTDSKEVDPDLTILLEKLIDTNKGLLEGLIMKTLTDKNKIKKIRRVLSSDSDDSDNNDGNANDNSDNNKPKTNKNVGKKSDGKNNSKIDSNKNLNKNESAPSIEELKTAPTNKRKRKGIMKKKPIKKPSPVKKPAEVRKDRKDRKTELDKLHEDIREMYIRDGVLAATGKRSGKLDDDDLELEQRMRRKSRTTATVTRNDDGSDDSENLPSTSGRQKTKMNYNEEPSDDESVSTTAASSIGEETGEEKVKKGRRKKKPLWKSGIIKQHKKKKTNEESDSLVAADSTDKEMFDKEYYLDPNKKSKCKLCTYEGKAIVTHYKNVHPKMEVLISRLSPEESENAIEETNSLDLERIIPFDEYEIKNRKKKFDFQCRFCRSSFTDTTANFADHITNHTGELRYHCVTCRFKTSNIKSFKLHGTNRGCPPQKPIIPTFPSPPNYKMLFGHLCGECNYVQLQKTLVEDHIEANHRLGTRIYKISMSIGQSPPILHPEIKVESIKSEPIVETKREIENLPEEVMLQTQKEEVMEPHKEEIIMDTQPEAAVMDTEQKDTKMDTEQEDTMKIQQEEPRTTEIKSEDTKEEDTQKEATVFEPEIPEKLMTDSENREETKMVDSFDTKEDLEPPKTEIANAINLLDLDLDVEASERETGTNLEPETVTSSDRKEEIQEPRKDRVEIAPALVPEPMLAKLEPKEEEKAKSVFNWDNTQYVPEENKEEKMNEITKSINEKKFSFNLLDKLKNRLTDIETVNVDSSDLTIEHVNIKKETVEEEDKVKVAVKEELEPPPLIAIQKTSNLPNLINIKEMVNGRTSSKESTCLKIGPIEAKIHTDTILYSCYMESCTFNTEDLNAFRNHCETLHRDGYWDGSCSICNLEGDKTTIDQALNHLIDVHVKNTPYEKLLPMAKPKIYLKMRRLSGDKLSEGCAKEEETSIENKESGFPFQITNVTTLTAEQERALETYERFASSSEDNSNQFLNDEPEQLEERKRKPTKSRKIVLRDVPLDPSQVNVSRKSPVAMEHFLRHEYLIHLYKCPEFRCKFSTDVRRIFDGHLRSHGNLSGSLVPCLYCNFQTDVTQVTVHIDVRHGRCRYFCIYCMYRACCQSYVEYHQRHKHPGNAVKVLTKLPINTEVYSTRAHTVYPPLPNFVSDVDKNVDNNCIHREPIKCTVCSFTSANTVTLMLHMRTEHFIVSFCRYCLYGGKSNRELYTHFSISHPSSPPHIVGTRWSPDSKNTIEPLAHLTQEIPTFANPEALIVYKCHAEPDEKPVLLTKVSSKDVPDFLRKRKAVTDESILKKIKIEPPMKTLVRVSGDNQSLLVNKLVNLNSSMDVSDDKSECSLLGDDSQEICDISGEETLFSDEMMKEVPKKLMGFVGKDLYKCGTCRAAFNASSHLKCHLAACLNINKNDFRPYRCAHCNKTFKSTVTLLEHMRIHGVERFLCSICDFRHQHPMHVRTHMKLKHKIVSVQIVPLDPAKRRSDVDEFVIRPRFKLLQKPNDGPVDKEAIAQETNLPKTTFGPDEIDLIPMNHIFNQDFKCALCTYQCKVRRNLIRHLQFHLSEKDVPVSDPVNPVPCLEKNEKMFDKMINLAASSVVASHSAIRQATEEENIPQFVVTTKRFVCGVTNCNYLCLEESMLRSHLLTLHADEKYYQCKHCKEERNGAMDIDAIVKHLRLHDSHLYMCGYCRFLHNMRHKVDRHVQLLHPDKSMCVIILREIAKQNLIEETQRTVNNTYSVSTASTEEKLKGARKWHCGMCRYRTGEETDIISHVKNKHDLDSKYKCAVCLFKEDSKEAFVGHFEKDHPGKNINIIELYFELDPVKNTSDNTITFDSTPLWQRNRNPRQIRGIPVDDCSKLSPKEESIQKVTRRLSLGSLLIEDNMKVFASPRLIEENRIKPKTNLDDCIEAVATGSSSIVSSAYNSILKASLLGAPTKIQPITDSETELDVEGIDEKPSFSTIQMKGTLGYGNPKGLQFSCPLCENFRTPKVNHFTNHLYKELECPRYRCKICLRDGFAKDIMRRHVVKSHSGLEFNVIEDLPVPVEKVEWVNNVIQTQDNIMKQGDMVHRCTYCSYTCKYNGDMRKHERRHWVQKPLRCGHCVFEAVTNYEINFHSKRSHPTKDVVILTVPIPNPEIRPLRAGPKKKIVTSPMKEESTPIKKLVSLKCEMCRIDGQEAFLQEHLAAVHYKVKSRLCYECETCHKTFANIEQFNSHWEQCFTRSKASNVLECSYCSIEFEDRSALMAHHNTFHSHLELVSIPPELPAQERCLKCPECLIDFTNYPLMLEHLLIHCRPYVCSYCSVTYGTLTRVKTHLSRDHNGLPHKYSINDDYMEQWQMIQKHLAALGDNSNIMMMMMKRRKVAGTFTVKKFMISKPTARKSTSFRPAIEYSFYGTKPDLTDLDEVTACIVRDNEIVTARPLQLYGLYGMDIFPSVMVEDCMKKK